jgi:hypothetical protein
VSLDDYLAGKEGAERPSWLRDLDDPQCFEEERHERAKQRLAYLLADQDARRELAAMSATTEESGWEPQNLALLDERPPVVPDLGRSGLLYRGRRHAFSGPPESAKTIAAYAAGLDLLREGNEVCLIDFEMGAPDATGLLRDLGASKRDLARLSYVAPQQPATPEHIAALVDVGPALVIIDAAAGAYALQGLDDNARLDAEAFALTFIDGFWRGGIATLVIDHVVKDARNRGRYAIGSERKLGGVDVHLGFEAVRGIRRGTSGLFKITTHKDRPGYLARPRAAELELHSDADTHALTWAFRAIPTDAIAETDGFRPTTLMARVSVFLEEQVEPVSWRQVKGGVGGKEEYVRAAIGCLVAEGYAREQQGARNARLFESLRPFREARPTPDRRPSTDAPTDAHENTSLQAENRPTPDRRPTNAQDRRPPEPGPKKGRDGRRSARVKRRFRKQLGDAD